MQETGSLILTRVLCYETPRSKDMDVTGYFVLKKIFLSFVLLLSQTICIVCM